MVRRYKHGKKNLEWMLTRERFQLTDEDPPADIPFVSIGDVLAGIFEKIGKNRQPRLDAEWESLLGDLTSGHARPAGMRGRTLIVHVDSSAWLNELVRFRRVEMLKRLQKRFGRDRIANISIKLAAESDFRPKKTGPYANGKGKQGVR